MYNNIKSTHYKQFNLPSPINIFLAVSKEWAIEKCNSSTMILDLRLSDFKPDFRFVRSDHDMRLVEVERVTYFLYTVSMTLTSDIRLVEVERLTYFVYTVSMTLTSDIRPSNISQIVNHHNIHLYETLKNQCFCNFAAKAVLEASLSAYLCKSKDA